LTSDNKAAIRPQPHSSALSKPLPFSTERRGEKANSLSCAPAGRSVDSLRLRWPSGLRMWGESASPRPACRLGPFYGSFPGGGCLVEVALPIWNKVLLVPIHLVFFCSRNGDGRVRWGSSYVETLFRSLPAAHRPGWKVRLLAFWFEDKEAVSGCVEVWRVDLVRISSGGVCCRRRAGVHGRWSLGCVPGRCSTSDGFIPFRTGVYCGYLQSLMAIGTPSDLGSVVEVLR